MTLARCTLRPCVPEDLPFLLHVYASTRIEELAPLGWGAEQQAAFLSQQFSAQHQHYHTHYTATDYQLILLDERPIGRLYVARWPDEIRIVDIALLPEHRDQRIGSQLIAALRDEAAAAGKPLRIHVEKFNRALRLYQRLGFAVVEDRGIYWFLEWTPPRNERGS